MFTFKNGRFRATPEFSRPAVPDSVLPDFTTEVKNKLESVVILTTSHEINNGLLTRLLDNISNTTSSTDIDLNIFTNNSNHNPVSLDKVNQIFKSVNLINVDIPPSDDVYIQKTESQQNTPPYGAVSGPNILFLKAMDICKKYNTVLVLETDCKVFPEWLEKSKIYVDNEYFLVSGSTYDGLATIPNYDISMHIHLNGVAFYKTGSPIFQLIMSVLDKYILYLVSAGDKVCAYDICITYMIFSYMVKSETANQLKFWRFAFRYIFKTSLIVNTSPVSDKVINESDILSTHKNCLILHKKY
jgi:hypothetical protein